MESLCTAILESLPGEKLPAENSTRWVRWAVELDRLQRLDGWDWGQIDAVLDWLPTHDRGEFRWGLVIRSAAKLRKHFARLHAEMKQSAKGNGGYRETPDTSSPPSAYDRAHEDALRRLRGAGRAGAISAAEIEAEIVRVDGALPDD